MAQKQYTLEIISYATVTAEEGLDIDKIPMKLDIDDFQDDEDSPVLEVNETEVIHRTITTTVDLK